MFQHLSHGFNVTSILQATVIFWFSKNDSMTEDLPRGQGYKRRCEKIEAV